MNLDRLACDLGDRALAARSFVTQSRVEIIR
jgi:hypothetical protein